MSNEDLTAIKENLLCPVCDSYMRAPIRQCRTGHSICDQCFAKVRKCPKCRGPKSDARCYTLEAIASRLSLPCRFKSSGCIYTGKGESIASHEKYCSYAPINCPFRTYDNCSWIGSLSKLNTHCFKSHPNNFYSRAKQKFLAKSFTEVRSYHYIYVIIYAYREYFRLTWDLEDNTGFSRWAIYYMGTKENAKKYSYKIEFPKESDKEFDDIPRGLMWKSPCGVAPIDDSVKFVDQNCLLVHRDLLTMYCEPSGDLNYVATIYRSRYCGTPDSDDLKLHRCPREEEEEDEESENEYEQTKLCVKKEI